MLYKGTVLIKKITHYLTSILEAEPSANKADPRIAIASLLCSVGYANHETSDIERAAIKDSLLNKLNIEESEANHIIETAEQNVLTSTSIFDFTSSLSDLTHDARIGVIDMMWRVAYSDNNLCEIEEAIIRRVAGLLYVPHSEFIRTKLNVLNELAQ